MCSMGFENLSHGCDRTFHKPVIDSYYDFGHKESQRMKLQVRDIKPVSVQGLLAEMFPEGWSHLSY